jgi:galactan endo-1,6-beta-galactosidase
MLINARAILAVAILFASWTRVASGQQQPPSTAPAAPEEVAVVDVTTDKGDWEGWGSSLAWWGRAVGGTKNADYYADLIYTMRTIDGNPGLGLNVVRYNVGGGGIDQLRENKGPKLNWYMDIHGYWVNPESADPESSSWNWSADLNQRTMMQKAHDRGANVFEMFSDSPMWWMNFNRSTTGADDGGNCLTPANYDRFATYLATVARYAADHWGVKFRSVEAFNEPSADWWKFPGRQEGCHFDVATQEIIIKKLRRALDQEHLADVPIAASDENDVDGGLSTWLALDSPTKADIGKVNAHGYYHGTNPYRGPNRAALHEAVGAKVLWQSEFGDPDGSGLEMARNIILDLQQLKPSAWVYWQPVEPYSGWGMINAKYVDTKDRIDPAARTDLIRVNRKFFVYGQFTRHIRPGMHLLDIRDKNSVAGYDDATKRLVIVTVSGDTRSSVRYDLSKFQAIGSTVERIATTTAPGDDIPDWKQHSDTLPIHAVDKSFSSDLYPKSVYTFVIQDVSTPVGAVQ